MSGTGLGLNLVEGFNGYRENAVWIRGQVHPLGEAEFELDREEPSSPWRIRTRDGAVDVRFTPEGIRREDKELGFAKSRFVQAIGSFAGTALGVDFRDIPGVTEDHEARW